MTHAPSKVADRAPAAPAPQAGPPLERALHDLTNALAASRAYGELMARRVASSGDKEMAALVESLLAELDRVGSIARLVRGGVIEEHQPGDVLACVDCGYTFVHRKSRGKLGSCRRCRSVNVQRWKP